MDVEIIRQPRVTLEQFADEHGLQVVVRERRYEPGASWWYAEFTNAWTMGVPAPGEVRGRTPAKALDELRRLVSGRRLATREYRKYIDVPILEAVR